MSERKIEMREDGTLSSGELPTRNRPYALNDVKWYDEFELKGPYEGNGIDGVTDQFRIFGTKLLTGGYGPVAGTYVRRVGVLNYEAKMAFTHDKIASTYTRRSAVRKAQEAVENIVSQMKEDGALFR